MHISTLGSMLQTDLASQLDALAIPRIPYLLKEREFPPNNSSR